MFKLITGIKNDVRRRGLWLDRDQAIQMDDILQRALKSSFGFYSTDEDVYFIDRFRRRVKEMQ